MKEKFEKAKDWAFDHAEEIACTTLSVFLGSAIGYAVGYHSGFKDGERLGKCIKEAEHAYNYVLERCKIADAIMNLANTTGN